MPPNLDHEDQEVFVKALGGVKQFSIAASTL